MKLSKSTIILLNLVLILVIALLAKSLIMVPGNVSAASAKAYQIREIPSVGYAKSINPEVVNTWLNAQSKGGWKPLCVWNNFIIFESTN